MVFAGFAVTPADTQEQHDQMSGAAGWGIVSAIMGSVLLWSTGLPGSGLETKAPAVRVYFNRLRMNA